jgi:hypothetical protein
MVKRLILPDWTLALQYPVDAVSRRTFDRLIDLAQAECPVLVSEGIQNEVDVIRHHDRTVEVKTAVFATKDNVEYQRTTFRREVPALRGYEGDEEGLVVRLEVGEHTAVVVLVPHEGGLAGERWQW